MTRLPLLTLAALCCPLLLGACKDQSSGPAPSPSAPSSEEARAEGEPPIPVVEEGAGDLLFSYVDARGRIQATGSVAEVPDDVRERVLVVDLSKTPEQRQAHRYAFFVDLTRKETDGTYPVTVVSRYDAAQGEKAPSLLPTVPEGTVILYSAVWCGFCKKAKKWLQENDVPFVERDVEKTAGAQAELQEKLKEAGIRGGGIPVLDWDGELIMGFDQRRLEDLLKARKG